MITGSPRYATLVASSLTFLSGDGSVATGYKANGTQTAKPADEQRALVLFQALQSVPSYDLSLAQFSNQSFRRSSNKFR